MAPQAIGQRRCRDGFPERQDRDADDGTGTVAREPSLRDEPLSRDIHVMAWNCVEHPQLTPRALHKRDDPTLVWNRMKTDRPKPIELVSLNHDHGSLLNTR